MLVPFGLHDGFEEHFATNALGHFRLMRAMLPLLRRGGGGGNGHRQGSRVIVVSSVVQHCGKLDMRWLQRWPNGSEDGNLTAEWKTLRGGYSCHAAYARSKLALQVLAQALAREICCANLPVEVHTVDPGIVHTPLYRHVHWAFKPVMSIIAPRLLRTAADAAAGVVWAAVSPELEGSTGRYYSQGRRALPVAVALDVAVQEAVWRHCCEASQLSCRVDGDGNGQHPP